MLFNGAAVCAECGTDVFQPEIDPLFVNRISGCRTNRLKNPNVSHEQIRQLQNKRPLLPIRSPLPIKIATPFINIIQMGSCRYINGGVLFWQHFLAFYCRASASFIKDSTE
jgi:hypothetical protein